jgi:hypothetical protein
VIFCGVRANAALAAPPDQIGAGLRLPLVAFVVGLSMACAGKPFVLEGDANYVGVAYAGDMESATAVAKRHCAPFERVPRFHEIEQDVAYFYCVRP